MHTAQSDLHQMLQRWGTFCCIFLLIFYLDDFHHLHINDTLSIRLKNFVFRSAQTISHHHQAFQSNHALNMFSNLMGVSNLQNLPPGDVLEKLKMQVGLIDPEFAMSSLRNLNASTNSPYGMQHGNEPPSNQHALSLQVSSSATAQPSGFQFTTPNTPNTKEGEHSCSFRCAEFVVCVVSRVFLQF